MPTKKKTFLIQLHLLIMSEEVFEIKGKSLDVELWTWRGRGGGGSLLNYIDSVCRCEEEEEKEKLKNFIVTFAENSHIFLINFFFFFFSTSHSHDPSSNNKNRNELLIIDSVKERENFSLIEFRFFVFWGAFPFGLFLPSFSLFLYSLIHVLIKGKLFIVFTDHIKEEEKSVSEWKEKSSSLFGQLKVFFLPLLRLQCHDIKMLSLQLNDAKRVR